METISNIPPKGTSDWFPEEFKIRKYIFDTWRSVCKSFGYEEYLTPIIESAEVYKAKSGEEVGGKELMIMTDRAGRELAIRPEMTPSVTRMISRIYNSSPKPIRYFSIANFLRNQKPQRGRNREFWQLNFDLFGEDNISADLEILQMALEIMLSFSPPEGSFTMFINNRKLIDAVLDLAGVTSEIRGDVVRILDKWGKLTPEDIQLTFNDYGLSEEQIGVLKSFMSATNKEDLLSALPELEENEGYQEIESLIKQLQELGYAEWVKFQPNIIRGFDYYDGMVFEIFDNHPENNRSLFGGGRYNGLAGIFGSKSFPAVGCAPGDETTKLFLESWGITDRILAENKEKLYYLPLLDEELRIPQEKLAQKLRKEGKKVETGLSTIQFGKAFGYADKKGLGNVVILGSQELENSIYKIKDLSSGEEKEYPLN